MTTHQAGAGGAAFTRTEASGGGDSRDAFMKQATAARRPAGPPLRPRPPLSPRPPPPQLFLGLFAGSSTSARVDRDSARPSRASRAILGPAIPKLNLAGVSPGGSPSKHGAVETRFIGILDIYGFSRSEA